MTSNRENDIAALEKPAHEYLKAAAKEYEGDPLGGGRDPGPLPGDEVDAEAERDQLAPEADAAARGEVREPIDMAALFRRMTAWRATHQGNPRALAGASTSGPLTPEDAAAIDDFLTREGC